MTFPYPPLRLTGVVEGDLAAVEAYKSSGGDIARQLTSDEVRLLNRPSAFDDGFTLVHLAIRFQRQDMLAVLLTEVSREPIAKKPQSDILCNSTHTLRHVHLHSAAGFDATYPYPLSHNPPLLLPLREDLKLRLDVMLLCVTCY